MDRRTFLGTIASSAIAAQSNDTEEKVDLRALVSRGDLHYDRAVERSEEGIPIGNGRMGTLVWTTATQVRMQINRADVYGSNSASNSFFERDSDYCGGCAFVDLDLGEFDSSRQHLSIYDGLLEAGGFRMIAHPDHDVFALEVETQAAIGLSLRMLRYGTQFYGPRVEEQARDHIVTISARSHTASSQLLERGDRIALTQDFREGEYRCKSAVAAWASEGKARIVNESTVRLDVPAGKHLLLLSSAATFDGNADVAEQAWKQIDAARGKNFATLARETSDWWHAFWSRGFIQCSGDANAALLEQNYFYFQYLMAATSRGKYPPKFNGMLWNTDGDRRTWGSQYWFANLSCYYEAVFASNRMELLDPVFAMYSGAFESCKKAARQQWGSAGMYIPETLYFDGLEVLPEEIATEMRELYLLRKPWEERSARFREFGMTKLPHSSRWNWIQQGKYVNGRYTITERGSGPYGPVTHILGTTAKVAYLYWRKYEYTLDRDWLRDRAYPMLQAAAEFYRNFPTFKKGADGKYHIEKTNSNESVWGARDSDEDLSAVRGVFAAAAKAAEILAVDPALREQWREVLTNLATLPVSTDANALKPAGYSGAEVFVRGRQPAVKAGGLLPDSNSLPMWFFDLCHIGTRNAERLRIANATLDASFRNGLQEKTPVSVLSKLAIAAALLGRPEAVRILAVNQVKALSPERGTAYRGGGVLPNRMTLREGPQALDAQRLGRACEAMQLALLQSLPPEPAAEPELRVFPSWPKEWDASFSLAARRGFVVSSRMSKGQVTHVELMSNAGAPCRLKNPWGDKKVTLRRDGKSGETLSGDMLAFPTKARERILVKLAT